MKTKLIFKLGSLAFVAVLVLSLAACATPSATNPAEKATAASEAVEPWEGDGMDIPLDGSSLEAFDKSLARVKAYADPPDYTTLINAIDYLLVYDLAANRDKAKLASHLNGLTGKQVIDKVSWQRK